MNLIQRLAAFRDRNRGNLVSKAKQEFAVRLWIRFRLWRVLGPILPLRKPRTWVFMGGCYNSGTTILRELIGSHPDVATLPHEGVEMTDAFPDLEADGWQRMWYRNADAAMQLRAGAPGKVAERAIRHWSPWWKRGAQVFLEKSIVHSAWMPFLQQGFGSTHFIGVVRNGYCACEGIRRRARPSLGARQELGADTYPLGEVGRQWVFANETLRRDRAALDHYLEIVYEELSLEPLRTIREIFRFIGVDEGAVTQDPDGTIRVGQRTFIIRDQNAESLARLSLEEQAELRTVIGPMMEHLGYEHNGVNLL